MPDKDDVFKRYLEAGLSFFEVTQQRAEAVLKDLAGSGESAKGQAQKAVDWVKERSRQSTDELRELVRNEIRSQVEALGLATRDDVTRVEARVEALERAGAATGAGAAGAPAAKTVAGSRKAAGVTKSASTRKAPAKAGRPSAKGAGPPGTGRTGAPGGAAAPEKG